MGVCLTSEKSEYEFDMGYIGFGHLRMNIAMSFDKELGVAYSDTLTAMLNPTEYNKRFNEILSDDRFKDEDIDIIEFLCASDCGGECSYETCGKIYNIIKDVDFGDEIFTYAAYSDGKDYEYLKEFLKECYTEQRKMIWY